MEIKNLINEEPTFWGQDQTKVERERKNAVNFVLVFNDEEKEGEETLSSIN